jgi:hypothetical protein
MGDRSPLYLIVAVCPPSQRAAIASLVDHYGLALEPASTAVAGGLQLGGAYTDQETSLEADDLATAVAAAAPAAAFACWQEPNSQRSGWLVCYTPRLGRYDTACDADGTAVATGEQVVAFLAGLPADATAADAIAAVDACMGGPWARALGRGDPLAWLAARPPATTPPPLPTPAQGELVWAVTFADGHVEHTTAARAIGAETTAVARYPGHAIVVGVRALASPALVRALVRRELAHGTPPPDKEDP